MEKITAGEIRVALKEKRPFGFRKMSIKELASNEFNKLGMNQTRDRTGILIYVLLGERQFFILADEGINNKVNQSTWDEVRNSMQQSFLKGHYTNGVLNCVDQVGNILSGHFPIKPDDTNELSNKVVLD